MIGLYVRGLSLSPPPLVVIRYNREIVGGLMDGWIDTGLSNTKNPFNSGWLPSSCGPVGRVQEKIRHLENHFNCVLCCEGGEEQSERCNGDDRVKKCSQSE